MNYFNLYGPINELGYGIATRGLIRGLESIGQSQFYLSPIGGKISVDDRKEANKLAQQAHSFLWNRQAPSVAIWHEFDLNRFSGNKLIAYPVFETTEFNPQAKNYLSQMDAVFVMSDWAKDIVINNIGNVVPVFTVPCSANVYQEKEGEKEDKIEKN